MIKVLYYLRLNAALVLALVFSLPFLWPKGELRAPASVERVTGRSCITLMRESLERHGGFTPRGPAIQERIPQFENRIRQIENSLFTPKSFARKFQEEKGRPPKVKEVIDFLQPGHDNLLRNIEALNEGIEQDREIKYYIEETLRALKWSDKEKQNIIDFKNENRSLLDQDFNSNDTDLIQKLERLWKNPYGDYGELIVALRTPGVEVQNLLFRLKPDETISSSASRHKNVVKTALDEKFQELEGLSTSQINELKSRYPFVFSEQRSLELEDIRNWIESKEVDLVIDVEGRGHYFLEIKNYSKKMTSRKLQDSYGNNKSVLDQQKEMVEIIHFLGLERKYIPAIFFLKGIDADAKEVLEENGVLVITDEIAANRRSLRE